jgi:lysophospholipase L1-like esterase
MSARGRFLSGLVTVVIALAGFVTVGALPAAATDSRTVQYVALGDSYAAGTAVGSFPNCPHSPIGYPALLDSEERIHLRANEACSGATTDEVADSQLSALNRGTRLVTLTVGGADLELSAVLTACTTGTQFDCLAAIDAASGGLMQLGDDLTDLYAEVADAAPRALIVVTGYPHLFAPEAAPFDPVLVDAINSAIDALNTTIEQAVEDADAADTTDDNIIYVDVIRAFGKHGIGGELPPFINPPGTADAFHPTAAGYVAYANAILAVLPEAWVDEQAQSA